MRMQSDAAARQQDRGFFKRYIHLDRIPDLSGRRG